MLFADLPIDVTRIIAALLVNNRPLLDVVRVRFDRPVCGPMYALQEAMTESLAAPAHASTILIRPHMYTTTHPFPDGINSVKAKCIRDRLRQSGLRYRV
jgi:hypothetical protein